MASDSSCRFLIVLSSSNESLPLGNYVRYTLQSSPSVTLFCLTDIKQTREPHNYLNALRILTFCIIHIAKHVVSLVTAV